MKKLAAALSAAVVLMVFAGPTFASNASPKGKGEICHEKSRDDACSNAHKSEKTHKSEKAHDPKKAHKPVKTDKPKKTHKPVKADKPKKVHPPKNAHQVPEIDAANAALALALMGGIVALRRERRRN